jgi:hypothetical protein
VKQSLEWAWRPKGLPMIAFIFDQLLVMAVLLKFQPSHHLLIPQFKILPDISSVVRYLLRVLQLPSRELDFGWRFRSIRLPLPMRSPRDVSRTHFTSKSKLARFEKAIPNMFANTLVSFLSSMSLVRQSSPINSQSGISHSDS